jgi:hypothetical protein
MLRVLRLVNVDRHVAIASGGMYQIFGMKLRKSVVRSVADKSSLGKDGNETPEKCRYFKRGADAFKNVPGRCNTLSIDDTKERRVNAGNGSCITART